MPYTPPSQRSPAVSNGSSPALSRTHSYHKQATEEEKTTSSPASPPRPNLPRSTSSSAYLSKHRRGPSFNNDVLLANTQENVNRYEANGLDETSQLDQTSQPAPEVDVHGSLRQSPPPVNNAIIPPGAMISPPDSSHNSSDDEDNHRGRTRDIANLAELQAAIREIELRKESSPARAGRDSENIPGNLGLDIPLGRSELNKSFSADDIARQVLRPPLSKEARKISHSRSSTDPNIVLDSSSVTESPLQAGPDSDGDDADDGVRMKPPMVRKKSGELVRPALRPSSAKRRPSSMPGTPTYSKAVHFDSHLEHVRHFLQVDKPLAVSAGSSPVENYDSEIEFPFGSDENSRTRAQSYEWEIKLSNFPEAAESRTHLPIRVERVFLSADKKNLIGQVAVQNLAFHKAVVARFTFDYWKTTSEVSAEYNNDIRRKQAHDGCDRFNFTIRITDIGNLENKTLFFCVRYNVNGQEFWDNNNFINYQVDFVKKAKSPVMKSVGPSSQSHSTRSLNGLPRSRPSPPVSKGLSNSFDDFSTGFDSYHFGQPAAAVIGDPQLKLRSPRARAQIFPDAPTKRSKPTSPQAFGHRYDFGASLNAAIQSASSILGDQSGLTEAKRKQIPRTVVVTPPSAANGAVKPEESTGSKSDPLLSQKPTHQSQSYQELVDKYCFFGSSKSSPQLTKSALGLVDGTNDETSISDGSLGSAQSDSSNSPPPSAPHTPSMNSGLKNRHLRAQMPRSSSPVSRPNAGTGSRGSSPLSFGYPYHSPKSTGFFEAHIEYAIRG